MTRSSFTSHIEYTNLQNLFAALEERHIHSLETLTRDEHAELYGLTWITLSEFIQRCALTNSRNRGIVRTLGTLGLPFEDLHHELLILSIEKKLDYLLQITPKQYNANHQTLTLEQLSVFRMKVFQSILSRRLIDLYYQTSGRSKKHASVPSDAPNQKKSQKSFSIPAYKIPVSIETEFFSLSDTGGEFFETEDFFLNLMGFRTGDALVQALTCLSSNPKQLLACLSGLAGLKPAQVEYLLTQFGSQTVYLFMLHRILPEFSLSSEQIAYLDALAPVLSQPMTAQNVSHEKERANKKVYRLFDSYR